MMALLNMSDEKTTDLLQRLKTNDRSALKLIFEQYYSSVALTIYRVTKDKSLSEDLAQEVFIRFWNKRETIQIKSSLSAYLRKMAFNEGIGYMRTKKNKTNEPFILEAVKETDPSAEHQYLFGELKEKIAEAINQLPPKCRMVFQMSRYDDMTYQEIADTLEISPKTVENQMGKALKTLRLALHQYL